MTATAEGLANIATAHARANGKNQGLQLYQACPDLDIDQKTNTARIRLINITARSKTKKIYDLSLSLHHLM
jgi:hypothetical protein